MIEGINFIGNRASKQGKATFKSKNPVTDSYLPETFHTATENEINEVFLQAQSAFKRYRYCSGHQKAEFLETIAGEIMELGDELIDRAMAESGLPRARLTGERGRTCNQLKLFAELVREGSWVDARIDTAIPERTPPKPDIRSMLIPIGPVVVFGASNFPLAFSTAGGDTASALAAGCPVIVKGHESHPGTNELVSRAIITAVKKSGMPEGTFNMVIGGPETGAALVTHPLARAVGFTGSFNGGMAIYDLVGKRDEPIPVYAEMGSTNPVFLLDEKLALSAGDLAQLCAASVVLGTGQFCTNPGIIIGQNGDGLERFKKALAEHLEASTPGCMLNSKISENYRSKRKEIFKQTGVEFLTTDSDGSGNYGEPAMATVKGSDFLENQLLFEEVFGPYTLVVACSYADEMKQIARKLGGQLTITFMGTDNDFSSRRDLIDMAREKAGRVIFNGVPTGVEVCPSMHHGGPFPATTDPTKTSVGTRAILRFARPLAFQDCPVTLLPDELKDENPLGIWRMVNGKFTNES